MEEDQNLENAAGVSENPDSSEQPSPIDEAIIDQGVEAVLSQEELPLSEKMEMETVVNEELATESVAPVEIEKMAETEIVEEPISNLEEPKNDAIEPLEEPVDELIEPFEETKETVDQPLEDKNQETVLEDEAKEEFEPFWEDKKEVNLTGNKSMIAQLTSKKNLTILAIIAVIVALGAYFWKQNSDSEYGNYGDIKVQVNDQLEQGKVSIIEEVNDDINTLSEGGSAAKPVMTEVVAFFGNTQKDPGTQDCSRVFALKREIPKQYDSNMLNSVLALVNPLSAAEKEAGYISLIPDGTFLRYIKLDDSGVAMANFSGGIAKTAGSCAVTAIKAQIRATLMQFSAVKSVVICVDDNCHEEEILQP
jgi:hypothetical protein